MGDCAGFKWFQGAAAKGIGYEAEVSPTLAVSDSHVPAVLTPWDVQSKRVYTPNGTSPTLQSGANRGMSIQPVVMTTANTNANGSNVNEDGPCYTLDGTNCNAVAFVQNTRDEVRLFGGDGQTVGALSAQPGMKQTSYVMTQYGDAAGTLRARGNSSPCADRGQNVVCMQDGQAKGTVTKDGTATTLNASHENPIVCMADGNGKTAIDEDMCGTLKVGGGSPMIAFSPTESRSSAPCAPETGRASVASSSRRGK